MNIYTDGAYSSKTNSGGWSVVLEDETYISGKENNTTNNRMELMAVLQALVYIWNTNLGENINTVYNIYTDSAYISNCFRDSWYTKWKNNGWKTADNRPVKNQDLWVEILGIIYKLNWFDIYVNIMHVKGHTDNKYNNLADKYAVEARSNTATPTIKEITL